MKASELETLLGDLIASGEDLDVVYGDCEYGDMFVDGLHVEEITETYVDYTRPPLSGVGYYRTYTKRRVIYLGGR